MNETENNFKSIQELEPAEKVTSFFVVRKKEIKTKKDLTPYLLLELGDRTGRISATLWENAKVFYDKINVGDIVKVRGVVIKYNDSQQLSIDKIRKAEPSDKVNPKDFVRRGKIDVEDLTRQFKETIDSVKNPLLRNLLDRLFSNQGSFNRFQEAPAGKLWHHAYLGGLLEHTMAVANVCETMTKLYPTADRDLLVTGALLHDIGKIDEYGYDPGFIDYTDEGRLWGHISIGAQCIRDVIEELEKEEGFPHELKKHLIHLILSHQGKYEHGSPVLPMTLEAMILYYADEMDSKANALVHIMERDEEPGRKWSKYVPVLDRFIYLGDEDEKEEESSEASFE